MALARVRGCAGQALPATGGPPWQADASRRRNGPRKATSRRPITVRLRSKSCLDGEYRVPRPGRRAVVAIEAANPSAGGCGDEDQVGRASAFRRSTPAEGGSRWTSPSRAGTPAFRSASAGMPRPSWPSSRSSIRRRSASTSRCRRSATRGSPTEVSGWSSRSGPGARRSGRRRPRTTDTRPSTWRSPSSRDGCAGRRSGVRPAARTSLSGPSRYSPR